MGLLFLGALGAVLFFQTNTGSRGVFRGGSLGHGPPLDRQWPLSMQNPEGFSTQTVGEDLCSWPASSSVPNTGLNLSEDFWC